MFQRVSSILNSKVPDIFELRPGTSHMPDIFDSTNGVADSSKLYSNLNFVRSFQSIPGQGFGNPAIKI